MCSFCPQDPEQWFLPPLHVAPCNCRMHRDDKEQDWRWLVGATGHVHIDTVTGEIMTRVVPQRRSDGDYMNGHVIDWLWLEAQVKHGRAVVSLPVPF